MEAHEEQVKAITGGLKMLDNGKLGGYAVLFTDENTPDLVGTYFTKDTDFGLRNGERSDVPIFFHHGLDSQMKTTQIGWGNLKLMDAGLWLEMQLKARDEYEREYAEYIAAIQKMVDMGKAGLSSGALLHTYEEEKRGNVRWIKTWTLGEVSITPTPAEPRTQVVPIKAYEQMLTTTTEPEAEATLKSDELKNVADEGKARVSEPQTKTTQGVQVMDNVQAPETTQTETVELNGGSQNGGVTVTEAKSIDALSKQLNDIMHLMESAPALRNSGYFSQDGGNADQGVKSFGDFLISVYRGDNQRIKSVYGVTKDMTEGAAGQGGVLVPEGYSNDMIEVMFERSPIMSRVHRVPVGAPSGRVPSLDYYATPTAGSGATAAAAGVTSATTAEGATLTETQPTFEEIQWNVHKIGGYTEVTRELMEDSPQAIESLLRGLFEIAINSVCERHVLRGSGAGEPLGILNAAAAVGVTPATDNAFKPADALGMLAKLKVMRGNIAFLMHPSIMPDFINFTASNADLVDWNQSVRASLLGYPIYYSEHLPLANASGAVVLADLSAYYWFERRGLSIGYSEHAAFLSEKGTWRFSIRADGQPAVKSAISGANPGSAYTQSPFVYHND